MKDQITQAVRAVLDGSRKVKITFKREAIHEVAYLLGMERSGIIKLDGHNGNDKMNLMCVPMSRDWGHDSIRTTVVTLTDRFDENWFVSLWDARTRIEDWRRDYNEVRGHSSLGRMTPSEFRAAFTRSETSTMNPGVA